MDQQKQPFSVKKNFLVLLFLLIGALTISCCLLTMIPAAAEGILFGESREELPLSIFMVFVFPFIFSAFVSIAVLLLSLIARQRWPISLPVSILFLGAPQIAYLIVWAASWAAHFFYEPTPEDESRTKNFFGLSILPERKMEDEAARLRQMKTLWDDGIITQEEFNAQKNQYLGAYQAKQKKAEAPRFFSVWQIAIAGILGGIFGGAILIALNYRRLKNNRLALTSFLAGFIGQVIFLALNYALVVVAPDLEFYAIFLVFLIYPIILYIWYAETQKETINELFLRQAAVQASWWLALLIGIAAGFLFLFCVSPLVFLFGALIYSPPVPVSTPTPLP